jgi:hypothetical protein
MNLSWELEVTPVLNPSARFQVSAQVTPQLSCWNVRVPVSVPSWVRIRPVSGTQISPWSAYTTVPEPGIAISSLAACALLARLAQLRRRVGHRS